MCSRMTKKQVDAKFRKKRRRESGFSGWVVRNKHIPNVCGAMIDGKKMMSHKIGQKGCERRFTPCRTKGVHPITGSPMTMQLHHINEDSSDDRKSNLVMLCPYCHPLIHVFLGKQTLYTYPNFVKWFKRNCTNPSSFYVLRKKGLLPSYMPCHPALFYDSFGEWEGWEDFVDEELYKNNTQRFASSRKPNSSKKHFALLVLNKIKSSQEWNKLIASMGGFKACGYLQANIFVKHYNKEWKAFGGPCGGRHGSSIRFHYLGKKAPSWECARVTKERDKLKKLIKKENKKKPMSDKDLGKALGIKRITVKCHRMKLKIPGLLRQGNRNGVMQFIRKT